MIFDKQLLVWMIPFALLFSSWGCSGSGERGTKPAQRPPGPVEMPRHTGPAASSFDIPDRSSVKGLAPSQSGVASAEHLSAADRKLLAFHCPFGRPLKRSPSNHGETAFVIRKGYALLHSSRRKTALWVCEAVFLDRFVQEEKVGKRPYKRDSALMLFDRSEPRDYTRSGYSRAQMALPSHQGTDTELQDETFLLSNVAPIKPELKHGAWKSLLDRIDRAVKKHRFAWVVTGSFLHASAKDPSEGYLFIGPNKVVVPTHFYKIVVYRNERGVWEAAAFVLENRKYEEPYSWSAMLRSVEWLEKRTGFTFMPDLGVSEGNRLKKTAAGRFMEK